jgi:ABC-type multidrug transport system ATPase subunit
VILSSHLLSDVEDVCDRVVIYYGGKIQAAGTLKDLLAEPDTLRITTPVLPRETLERVAGNHPQGRFDRRSARGQSDAESRKLFSRRGEQGARRRTKPAARNPARAWPNICAAAWKTAKPATEKVLEKLSHCRSGAQPTVETKPRRATAAAPKVDDKKLEALAQSRQPHRRQPSPRRAGSEAGGFVEGG